VQCHVRNGGKGHSRIGEKTAASTGLVSFNTIKNALESAFFIVCRLNINY